MPRSIEPLRPDLMSRSILLLGASGFVGRNVAETFQRHGVPCVGRSRRDGWDLTDDRETTRQLRDLQPDVIVNCAAMVGSLNYVTEQAADVADQNLRMLASLYRAAAQEVPRATIIHPVANCAFPGHLTLYREDSFWDGPLHPSVQSYGSTRRMLVVLAECYRMQHGLRSVNLFVPNMYGAHDSCDPNKAHALNALVSKVVAAKARGDAELPVWGSGVAVREWLYAGDFARLLIELLPRLGERVFDEPVNIGQKQGLSVREILAAIVEETGYQGRITWDTARPEGAPCKVMDDERFRQLFPRFGFTQFRSGLRSTIEFYESIYPYSMPQGVLTSNAKR